MGNINMPSSLTELAKYCDCLENPQKFKHQQDPSEKSQKAQAEQQREETPKKQQPRRMVQQNIENMLLEQPPQVKLQKPSSSHVSMKRRSNLQIRQNQNQISKQKIDEISDISHESQANNRTNDLQIFRVDKDEDVKANDQLRFLNPLFRTANDFKPRGTAPLIQTNLKDENRQFDDIEISEINEPPSHDYQHQFFLNQEDKEEYRDKRQ